MTNKAGCILIGAGACLLAFMVLGLRLIVLCCAIALIVAGGCILFKRC